MRPVAKLVSCFLNPQEITRTFSAPRSARITIPKYRLTTWDGPDRYVRKTATATATKLITTPTTIPIHPRDHSGPFWDSGFSGCLSNSKTNPRGNDSNKYSLNRCEPSRSGICRTSQRRKPRLFECVAIEQIVCVEWNQPSVG